MSYKAIGLQGGMGSPARLPALAAYRPALVPVVFGIYALSVSGREIGRTPNRTAFFRHRFARACPSLLSQSLSACLDLLRLEHRYAASFRSEYKPSSVLSKILLFSMYRFNAEAMTLVSVALPNFASLSDMSDAVRGLLASRRIAWTWKGMLSGRNPVALRRLFLGRSSPSFFRANSSSLIFFLWSSMADRITWAASLIFTSYQDSLLGTSLRVVRTALFRLHYRLCHRLCLVNLFFVSAARGLL